MIPGSSLFDRYHNAILNKIEDEIELTRKLQEVGADSDFPAVRQRVGYLAALRKMEGAVTEIFKEITES